MTGQPDVVKPRLLQTLGIPLVLAAASTVMLWLSLPGFEQWYLSFVSLVPVLVLLQGERPVKAVLLTWLSGFAFYFIAASWLSHLTPMGWLSLALYLSLGFLVFAVLVRVLEGGTPRLPFVVGVPVLWLAVQLARSLPLGGFDWFLLGHNLYRRLPLIQTADLFGVAGVSFVVVTVSAALARLVHLVFQRGLADRRDRREAVVGTVYAVLLVLATLTYGTVRLAQTDLKPGPTVTVVQGNIPQDIKELAQANPAEEMDKAELMWKTYADLTRALPAGRDDLVGWPETTTAVALEGDRTEKTDYSAVERGRVLALRRELGRPLMVGSIRIVEEGARLRYYNCAYYFGADDGTFERSDKIYPGPFGEEVPFKGTWFAELVMYFMPEGYQARLSPGSEVKLFRLKEWTFAADICFEDTKPSLNREFRRRGAQFVVNLTNDGWFRDSAELDQHLANSVFRCVENRLSQVRATNTGVSAFINATGAVVSFIRDASGKHRLVQGVLTDTVMLDARHTVYTSIGEIFWWTTLGCAVLWVLVRAVKGVVRLFRRA
ncbi:MAG TPA: apolipoprotein N-acyltransferase [Planctomycetota bacterium]|nr:apolipoprotein N-acyltransferase [Planctomycetota bacterium]